MREFRVVVIDSLGRPAAQVWALPGTDPIPQIQATVGGITRRSAFYELTPQFDVWFGVDAAMTHTEPNPTAQTLAYVVGMAWQDFHGPIVIVGRDIATGSRVGLTEQQAVGFMSGVANVYERLLARH
jgi:hypothetical protein